MNDTPRSDGPLFDGPLPTHREFDALAKRIDTFNTLHGAAHKAELMEMTRQLSDLRPECVVVAKGDSNFRRDMDAIKKRQEPLHAASRKEQLEHKPLIQGEAMRLGTRMISFAKEAGSHAGSAALAKAYLRDGAAHPALEHYVQTRSLARAAQQRQLWQSLYMELRTMRGKEQDQDFGKMVYSAIAEFRSNGGTLEQDLPDHGREIGKLLEQPSPYRLGRVLEMLETRMRLFDGGYSVMLERAYEDDSKKIESLAKVGADPLSGHSETLEVLYNARWTAAAKFLGERMQTNAVSVGDPAVHLANESVPEVSGVTHDGGLENENARER